MNIFNNLSEIFNGGLIAIVGVIIGAVSTYFIETSRIKKEENKTLLKNIYFRIFTELKYCFLTQNAFRKAHDVAKSVTVWDVKDYLEKLLEENIGIIDYKLFNLYHKIKSEQFFDDLSGGADNYKYLAYYCSLLRYMLKLDKSTRILDKNFKKDVKELSCKYAVWFFLMNRIKDWEKVEDILNKSFHFKRSYETITKSILLNNVYHNPKIDTNEFTRIFVDYCQYEIAFPFLHKYFWVR